MLGYLALPSGYNRYSIFSAATADQFQATLFTTGGISQVNLLDLNTPATTGYLAGLIPPGLELSSSSSSPNIAVLGGASPPTSQGSTPQSSGTTSIFEETEYETAIWNYSATSSAITAFWVNHDGSTLSTSIVYDSHTQSFYLMPNPSHYLSTHPTSYAVTFLFV